GLRGRDALRAVLFRAAVRDDHHQRGLRAHLLLGSWRNIYILVLGAFVLFVAVFWGLTEAYA
ncbi:hypothetical protein FH620_24695, partial [Corallococcus exiguus]